MMNLKGYAQYMKDCLAWVEENRRPDESTGELWFRTGGGVHNACGNTGRIVDDSKPPRLVRYAGQVYEKYYTKPCECVEWRKRFRAERKAKGASKHDPR